MKKIMKRGLALICAILMTVGLFSVNSFALDTTEDVNITAYNQSHTFDGWTVTRNMLVGNDGYAYYCINPYKGVGNEAFRYQDYLSTYSKTGATDVMSENGTITKDMVKYILYYVTVYAGTNPDQLAQWGATMAIHKYPVSSFQPGSARVVYDASSNNPVTDILNSAYSDEAKILAIAEFLTNKAAAAVASGFDLAPTCSVSITKTGDSYIEGNNYVVGTYTISGTYSGSPTITNYSTSDVIVAKTGNTLKISIPLSSTNQDVRLVVSAEQTGYDVAWYESVNNAGTSQDVARLVPKNSSDIKALWVSQSGLLGNFEVTKKDADTGALLSGVTFTLTNTDTNTDYSLTTNASGVAQVEGVPYGHYKLVENATAVGYSGNGTTWNDIEISDTNKNVSMIAYNSVQKRPITIVKRDAETGETAQGQASLSGAVYEIYNAEKTAVVDTVSLTGNSGVSIGLPVNKTYYLKEKTAPTGYTLDTEYHEVFLAHGDGAVAVLPAAEVTMTDIVIKGTITINKKGNTSLGGNPTSAVALAGAVFTIKNGSEQIVDIITTNSNGTATSIALPYGTYTVTETTVPTGYQAVAPFSVTISAAQNYSYDRVDQAIVKGVTIEKRDTSNNMIEKAGTKFEVYSRTTNEKLSFGGVSEFTTDATGTIILPNEFTFGTYYLKETTAPEGYVKNDSEIDFTINADSPSRTVIAVQNEQIKGSLEVLKTNDAGDPVPGAGITLYHANGQAVETKTTNTDGKVLFENVVYGNYYFAETSTPSGYVANTAHYNVSITENGLTVHAGLTNNRIRGNIKIVKKTDANVVLPGCVIGLYDTTDNLLVQKTTNGSGEVLFENVLYGTYYYKEISAPEGYIMNGNKHFVSITSNGQTLEKSLTNTRIKANIRVTKVNEINQTVMGCEIGLFTEGGTLVEKKTTGANGEILFENVDYGKYYVQEVSEPEGYVKNETKYPVTISNTMEVSREIVNNRIRGNLRVTKKTAGGDLLSGCEITLYDANSVFVAKATTDGSGTVLFENLLYGSYYYKETVAPTGYVLDNTKYGPVAITLNGVTVDRDMTNTRIKGIVLIRKVDKNNDPVSGCEISLYESNGTFVAKAITDNNGIVKFEDVGYGSYYYKETAVPEGFVLNTAEYAVEVRNHGATVEGAITNDRITGVLVIKKTDKDGTVLAGCEISLYDKDHNLITKSTTGETGEVRFEGLLYGDYFYKETVAPTGFVPDDSDHAVQIRKNGAVVTETLTNEKIKGTLVVNKVDGDGNPVDGCVIALYLEDGTLRLFLKTDENGQIMITDIPYGNYYYQELSAPEGYVMNNDKHEFTITQDKQVVKETLVNEKEMAPKTGDTSNIFLWVSVFVVSIGACFMVLKTRKKTK